MLAPLLHYSSLPNPISVVLPQARGSVAPLRHEGALIEYLEKQRAHCQRSPSNITNTSAVMVLRRLRATQRPRGISTADAVEGSNQAAGPK
jgi:hypothetical protein